ncbi:MAG: cytochrome c biogenesis protein CcsA [Gammaproteobacteria bacterium]|nr:cytochrome c biogenesis protein CcsA [Gammaproteobacteria bacterium]NVK87916.1 cytochrome c biogenesis protein CcsA [Gammaproteobacteria bacterium]
MEQTLNPTVISGLFTVCLYFMAVASSLLMLRSKANSPAGFNLLTFSAIGIHGFYLYLAIDNSGQQNLNLWLMMGLTNWLALLVLMFNSLKRPVTLMIAIIGSFAALTTTLSLLFPGEKSVDLSGQWLALIHIFAAMIATGMLMLASVQAILVIIADRQLRSHPTHIPSFFPPLQSLESFLFQLLMLGFGLMSVALLIAFAYLDPSLSPQPLHKLVLSSLAWVVFAVLIIGHRLKGWRGRQAAHWTLGGFALLSLGYFGSKLVLELILNSPAL